MKLHAGDHLSGGGHRGADIEEDDRGGDEQSATAREELDSLVDLAGVYGLGGSMRPR